MPTAKQFRPVLSDRLVLFYAGGSRDLRCKVVLLLLDAFAELIADEARQLDAGARVLGGSCNDLGDRGLVVANEQLGKQRVLLAELGETAFDDLREGQAVTFDVGRGPKGPRGDNVRLS